jgi:hypothetical protein
MPNQDVFMLEEIGASRSAQFPRLEAATGRYRKPPFLKFLKD